MLESLQNQNQIIAGQTGKPAKILRYVENDRMGGKVPMWEIPKTSKEQVVSALSTAQSTEISSPNSLSYTGTQPDYAPENTEEFGFSDLLDMVNPLHHIPVVGHVYRELSGDNIQPISQIIGGAVFGGPAGAASGLINTVIETETGKDVTGNAMAMMLDGEAPSFKHTENIGKDTPIDRLNKATESLQNPYSDLPGSLLSFADLKSSADIKIERISGSIRDNTGEINLNNMPPREPITQVRLSGLYALAQ